MNKKFQGLNWSHVSETTIFRPGVAIHSSHVKITMTVYAMAMLFEKKISVIQYFLCSEFVLISLSSISGM